MHSLRQVEQPTLPPNTSIRRLNHVGDQDDLIDFDFEDDQPTETLNNNIHVNSQCELKSGDVNGLQGMSSHRDKLQSRGQFFPQIIQLIQNNNDEQHGSRDYQYAGTTQKVGLILQNIALYGDDVIQKRKLECQQNSCQFIENFKNHQVSENGEVLPQNQEENKFQSNQQVEAPQNGGPSNNLDNSSREQNKKGSEINQTNSQFFATDQDPVLKTPLQQNKSRLSQETCSCEFYSPFEATREYEIPPALYLDILCQQLGVPEEHSIAVLIFIDRVCGMSTRNVKRIKQRLIKQREDSSQLKGQPLNEYLLAESAQLDQFFKDLIKIEINSMSIHRLILIAVIATNKFYSDFFYGNSYSAQIFQSPYKENIQEINILEQIFIDTIQWEFNISPGEYFEYYQCVTNFFDRPLNKVTCLMIENIVAAAPIIAQMFNQQNETEQNQQQQEQNDQQDAKMEDVQEENNVPMVDPNQLQYLLNQQMMNQQCNNMLLQQNFNNMMIQNQDQQSYMLSQQLALLQQMQNHQQLMAMLNLESYHHQQLLMQNQNPIVQSQQQNNIIYNQDQNAYQQPDQSFDQKQNVNINAVQQSDYMIIPNEEANDSKGRPKQIITPQQQYIQNQNIEHPINIQVPQLMQQQMVVDYEQQNDCDKDIFWKNN